MASFKRELYSDSGQVLLIVVLIMIVALTIGLSVVSRSITSLRTSTEEASSQKALAAAEAGIEQALKSGLGTGTSDKQFASNVTYRSNVQVVSGGSIALNGGSPVLKDEGVDLWVSDYSTDSSLVYQNPILTSDLRIFWGYVGSSLKPVCQEAAVEIIVVYQRLDPFIKRYAYDPCNQGDRGGNGLPDPNNDATPAKQVTFPTLTQYAYKSVRIDLTNATPAVRTDDAIFIRIIPLYSDTIVGARVAGAVFPPQGSLITSTGTSQSDGTKRAIQVFQGYPKIHTEFFNYNIFSP